MKLLLLLSAVVATTLASNSYVVVAPSSIRPNMDFAVSVNILAAPSDVTIKASIIGGMSTVVENTAVFTPGDSGLINLKVPDVLPRTSFQLKLEGSGGLTFTNQSSLQLNDKEISLFIQSDKAIYKPGDMVNFRVFGVYADLKMFQGPMDISVYDAAGNKIKEWTSATPDTQGVVTQELPLSTQPVLGDWKLSVVARSTKVDKLFTVAEYVLPKFEVDVIMPPFVLTTDSDITFTVKSKYTYGKPVQGSVAVLVKLQYSYNHYDYSRALPVTSKVEQIDGEVKVTIPMSSVKAVSQSLNTHILIVEANVTESLTGNQMSSNGTVTMYDRAAKLEFPGTNPETFKPGLEYTAYLKVSQVDGLPLAAATGKITVKTRVTAELPMPSTTPYYWYQPPTETRNLPDMTLDIPDNGLVAIPLSIPADAKQINIDATYDGLNAHLSLDKSYSPSDSYIQIFLTSQGAVQSGDTIAFQVKSTQPLTSLVYQIMSRGSMVKVGTVYASSQTDFSFSLTTAASMAPNARIVVYYVRADGEIVTDSISFDISGAMQNKVSINVDQSETQPGQQVKITVQADPNSVAHMLAIDQSVLLLKSGNDVTAADVYDELKSYDTIKPKQDILPFFGGGVPCPNCRRKRSIWWPYPTYYGGSDAKQIFENAGVVVITDALVFQHQEPIRPPIFEMPLFMNMANSFQGPSLTQTSTDQSGQQSNSDSDLKEPGRVRSKFVETWIWNDVPLGANGTASITSTVPDTITSWVASAFAVNDASGLGVAPTQAHLKVFKPFFVSLNLPYSVTRGEQLALQAIVFNYLNEDMQVRVTLASSPSFYNIQVDANGAETMQQMDAVQDILVPSGLAKSVYFPIVPAELGRIDLEVKAQSTKAADAVRRQLLVEAEGVPKEYNIPVLVDLTNGTFSKTVDLTLPPNVVQGSQFVRVSAVGDLMGPTIAGLDSLLRMPTGCGEQTMIGLAPDVYVTDYLKSVNQLSGEIETKALGFMESGYQRELTYKHQDGSFSAFGNNDDSGSMWLTAFVTRVLHQAKRHIYVDDSVLYTTLIWMRDMQNGDGSFPEPGRVIHKDMQGKASSGVGLTLFVTISMLESRDILQNTNAAGVLLQEAIDKAIVYCEAEVAKTDDLYTLAMASYAFQLAGSSQTQTVLDRLEQKATVEDGLKWWARPQTAQPTQSTGWYSPNPTKALDTEMTAYVLLTYAARKDVVAGKDIMQWLTKQRNANGGFTSTQDTVVALNALSEYTRQTFGALNAHITAGLDARSPYTFDIDQNNSLLLQTRETKQIPSQVTIAGTGSGLALIEIAVFFNVEVEIEEVTFDLTVKLIQETMNYLVVETCTRWLGDGPASGMAIQEIGIPSGFEPDLESISQLAILKRMETQNKKVILYFDEIGSAPVCLNFRADRTGMVAKSMPVAIRVYDYYEPGNQVTGFYQSQILKDSNVCDVCKECENCV